MYHDQGTINDLLDAAPRDTSGARAIVLLLDPGSTAWRPEGGFSGRYGRPEEKTTSIPVVYLRTADGAVTSRMVARPCEGGEAHR